MRGEGHRGQTPGLRRQRGKGAGRDGCPQPSVCSRRGGGVFQMAPPDLRAPPSFICSVLGSRTPPCTAETVPSSPVGKIVPALHGLQTGEVPPRGTCGRTCQRARDFELSGLGLPWKEPRTSLGPSRCHVQTLLEGPTAIISFFMTGLGRN